MDDVWSRRSAEQAARDLAHTKRQQALNWERIQRQFAEQSARPAAMPRDVEVELSEADEVAADEQRESWECAGSRDVGEPCWCGRCA